MKQYLLADYYGNKDYGKRALYILDDQGQKTYSFIFKADYPDYEKEMKAQGIETVILTEAPNQPINNYQ